MVESLNSKNEMSFESFLETRIKSGKFQMFQVLSILIFCTLDGISINSMVIVLTDISKLWKFTHS
jgi:hypothetical protein